MENNASMPWPIIRLPLPLLADQEETTCITQAAVDAGALGGAAERESLILYLPQDADEKLIEAVCQAAQEEVLSLGWAAFSCQRDLVADEPWATAWKKDFKTLPIGRNLLIRPDWERGVPAPEEWCERKPIWLRPGSGFGTGRHETTRLALEMLESHLDQGWRVLDFGSGSGVLSIAAIRLGAASVTAVEFDPAANVNARENFELNGCRSRIYLHETSQPEMVSGQFDMVICNMLPQHAVQHFQALADLLEGSEALLIYTGFLSVQQLEIKEALAQAGLVAEGCAQLNEWSAFVTTPAHHAKTLVGERLDFTR